MRGLIASSRCMKAIHVQMFFYVLSSLLAQTFISIRHVTSPNAQFYSNLDTSLFRAYALSRLNRKLLWMFLTLGAVHVGLGIALLYDTTGRGKLCVSHSLRDSFVLRYSSCTHPGHSIGPFHGLLVRAQKNDIVRGCFRGIDPRSRYVPHNPQNANYSHSVRCRHDCSYFDGD